MQVKLEEKRYIQMKTPPRSWMGPNQIIWHWLLLVKRSRVQVVLALDTIVHSSVLAKLYYGLLLRLG